MREKGTSGAVLRRHFFFSTGRGAFSFGKTKENGGRIPRGDPAISRAEIGALSPRAGTGAKPDIKDMDYG